MHRNKRKGLYFIVIATCLKLIIAFWLVNGCARNPEAGSPIPGDPPALAVLEKFEELKNNEGIETGKVK